MHAITRRATVSAAAALALAPRLAAADEGGLAVGQPAPEFTGINNWLNSPPLTMAGLRGKVVLIDFWTYSCINCLRTLPYLTRWYDSYGPRGLVIVGVHTPEFAFERSTANVATAIKRFGIKYPVAQDNSMATWNAYSNQYWPGEYLIDQQGKVVLTHFGEGRYDETENAIRRLVSAGPAVGRDNGVDLSRIGSPEMYLGAARLEYLSVAQQAKRQTTTYVEPPSLAPNTFALIGSWSLADEFAQLEAAPGGIALSFRSGKAYMVASSPSPVTLNVQVDGKAQPPVTVDGDRLYTLFDSTDYGPHVLVVQAQQPGLKAFSFTFG